MSSPYNLAKMIAGTRMVVGVIGMMLGLAISRTPNLFLAGVIVSVISVRATISGFRQLMNVVAAEANWRTLGARRTAGTRDTTNLPRRVFALLFSVAEADGSAGQTERQLVRQFVLERFRDPAVARDLMAWNATPLAGEELDGLIHEIRATLSRSECETVFFWCCCVTLIDERFNQTEQEILQQVSKAFGIDPNYARTVFLNAKARILAGRAWREASEESYWQGRNGRAGAGGSGGGYGGSRAGPTTNPASDRRRAFQVLGLEPGASLDEVRSRHRELVKKHHPDRHRHLGEVAQEEAGERFREVQEAYETLTKGA